MVITKLVLHNFGIYAGNNIFEFKSSKPIVLIGGMNGRGKTTFLEGVLLALYGGNSFAYNESKYQSYSQYLKAYVNTLDNTLETYVELEFKIEGENEGKYLIRRSWSGNGQRVREKIQVKKENKENVFLTENWSMFIENVLPSALASFFFFDGEKISQIAVEENNHQMKESIKNMLGISILDMLDNDITKIITKIARKSNDKIHMEKLETLRQNKQQANEDLNDIDKRILEIEEEIYEITKKLEKAKIDYVAKGGTIIDQFQDLIEERTALKAKIDNANEVLINIAAGELPLLLVKEHLMDIQNKVMKEHEIKLLNYTIDKINSMYKTYSKNPLNENNEIQKFISYVENKATEENTEIIFNISDLSLFKLNSLLKNDLNKAKNNMLENIELCNKGKLKIDEIDNYLSVDIDEKIIRNAYKKIKKFEQEIIDLEVIQEDMQKKRITLNGNLIRITSEYNNFVENILGNLEIDDDNDRILKYANYATQILREYKIKLQKQKIDVLAKTMTSCYKSLSNKKNMINSIEINEVTLDIRYLNKNNKIVLKESLSAGEKQLMVISFYCIVN